MLEKSYSCVRANSVPGCLDDRGAGVSNANPDFRVLKWGEREDGPHEGDVDCERRPERDQGENTPELLKRRPEDPDRVSDTEDWRSQEASIEPPNRRHVPGGAWLSKHTGRHRPGSSPVKQEAEEREKEKEKLT
ncbi:hypothetical protein NDU88_000041 [Pleurodeles waltl]|uniref:Uncharacterized protein n=1 Tax=Pleurodeles waltl TaxID=8319 RepID=A0AAV7KNP7_PLEWA|nr:hypothetical protein NDU88_000041 [Pleurodeles waltl]